MSEFSEEIPKTPAQVGLRYGLIMAAMFVVITLVSYQLELERGNPIGYLIFAVGVGLTVLAHKNFKEQNSGSMTYGQGVGIAAIMFLVLAGIAAFFTYVYLSYVDSTILDMIEEQMRKGFEDGGASPEEVEEQLYRLSFFFSPLFLAISTLIGQFLINFVISLIVTAFTQKSNPNLQY